jgi:hypothetical protein
MHQVEYSKTQIVEHTFMLSANYYMFRHQGEILRDIHNNK